MRNRVVDVDTFTLKKGREKYEVDLPDGHCQIDYELYSDGPLVLFVVAGKSVLPLDRGHRLCGRSRVRDMKSLLIRPDDKSQIVAIRVYHKELKVLEPLDDTPVEIVEPEGTSMSIYDMVGRIVGEHLVQQGVAEEQVSIEELVEDLPGDVDAEFGPGFMEMDEEYEKKRAARVERGKSMRRDGRMPDGEKSGEDGDGQDTGGEPGGDTEPPGDAGEADEGSADTT